MSQLASSCPFDTWKDGKNTQLKGGQLLAVTTHRFAYGFFDDDGRFKNALIARLTHGEDIISLLTTHSNELAHLLKVVLARMGNATSYNVYANEGPLAGMTVGNHAHLHVVRRNAGEPSSGMGLGKLVTELNAFHRRYDELDLAYNRLAWTSST